MQITHRLLGKDLFVLRNDEVGADLLKPWKHKLVLKFKEKILCNESTAGEWLSATTTPGFSTVFVRSIELMQFLCFLMSVDFGSHLELD